MGDSQSQGVKKKGSFRSLFSRFRRSSSKEETLQHETPYRGATGSSPSASRPTFSTVSLPTDLPRDRQPERSCYNETSTSSGSLPNEISPPFSRTPSSSSSSTSSVDYGSETSTPITTPSNSSPSILMKASDSALDSPVVQEAQGQAEPGTYSQESTHNPRRSPRNIGLHRKQPSPLSTVTGVQSPYNTGSPKSQESRTLGRPTPPKRRKSISRLLVRRTKSTPDLTLSDDDDDYIPAIPSIPLSAPTSRPTSATSTASSAPSLGRKLSLLRRPSTSSRPVSMIDDSSVDTSRSKEEHLLILGADPSGPGFYLYPTTKEEQISRRKSAIGTPGRQMNRWSVEDYKRRSWSSAEQAAYENGGGHSMSAPPPPRRGRPGTRGPSFRGNVANQVILEESSEGYESPVMGMRRHSGDPRGYQNWPPQPRIGIESPPTVSVSRPPQYTSIDVRSLVVSERRASFGLRPSLHNSWDHITAYLDKYKCEMSTLAVPATKKRRIGSEYVEFGEEDVLRKLQLSAMSFMSRSSEALYEEEGFKGFDDSGRKATIPGIPILKVELVDV